MASPSGSIAKNCLVIGADGGVGREVAAALIARGHAVTATVLGGSAIDAARAALPGIVAVHDIDLSHPEAAEARLAQVIGAMPDALDALILCAARMQIGPIETCDLAVWREVMDLNIVAPLATYKASIAALRSTKGRLIFVSSVAGKQGAPLHGSYTSSKFGLEGLADTMRQEASLDHVDVVLLEPGGMQTPMVDFAIGQAERLHGSLDPAQAALYGEMLTTFVSGARGALARGALMAPAAVAAAAVEAVEASRPHPRYAVGDEARSLFAAIAGMTDRDRDQLVSASFTSVARQ